MAAALLILGVGLLTGGIATLHASKHVPVEERIHSYPAWIQKQVLHKRGFLLSLAGGISVLAGGILLIA